MKAAPRTGPATPAEVHRTFREELSTAERATLTSWLAFTVTFGAVRALTYSIRAGVGPFHNLSLGGEHLHHYLWGIGMLVGVGGVAINGSDRQRRHPLTAAAYGSGLALIVDEFALLLDLRDVYWERQGRISVDVGVGLIAISGTALASIPLWLRLHQRRQRLAAAPGDAG